MVMVMAVAAAIAGVAFAIGGAQAQTDGPSAGAVAPSSPSSMVSIAQCRLLDTRPGGDHIGARGTFGSGETGTVAVTGTHGNCTIPTTVIAISANVTIVNPAASSFLSISPAGNGQPSSSNLNWVAGQPATPN